MRTTKHTRLFRVVLVAVIIAAAFTLSACGGKKTENGGGNTGGKAESFDVSLHDDATKMWVEPAEVTVKKGSKVVFNVSNAGTVVHNLKLDGGSSTADLPTAAAGSLDLGTIDKDTVAYCTIPGHREQGMEMKIKVNG